MENSRVNYRLQIHYVTNSLPRYVSTHAYHDEKSAWHVAHRLRFGDTDLDLLFSQKSNCTAYGHI